MRSGESPSYVYPRTGRWKSHVEEDHFRLRFCHLGLRSSWKRSVYVNDFLLKRIEQTERELVLLSAVPVKHAMRMIEQDRVWRGPASFFLQSAEFGHSVHALFSLADAVNRAGLGGTRPLPTSLTD